MSNEILRETAGLVRDLALAVMFGAVATILTHALRDRLDLEALGLTELDGWLDQFYPVQEDEG